MRTLLAIAILAAAVSAQPPLLYVHHWVERDNSSPVVRGPGVGIVDFDSTAGSAPLSGPPAPPPFYGTVPVGGTYALTVPAPYGTVVLAPGTVGLVVATCFSFLPYPYAPPSGPSVYLGWLDTSVPAGMLSAEVVIPFIVPSSGSWSLYAPVSFWSLYAPVGYVYPHPDFMPAVFCMAVLTVGPQGSVAVSDVYSVGTHVAVFW